MLPVNVIMPEDKEQMALTINEKKRNIHKKEFRKTGGVLRNFTKSCGKYAEENLPNGK